MQGQSRLLEFSSREGRKKGMGKEEKKREEEAAEKENEEEKEVGRGIY